MTELRNTDLGKTVKLAWVRATGSDALRFLNGMWTCDVQRVWDNAGIAPGYVLEAKGKLVVAGWVARFESEDLWMLVPEEHAEILLSTLDRLLVADDVVLEKVSAPWPWGALVLRGTLLAKDEGAKFEVPRLGSGSKDLVSRFVVGADGIQRALVGRQPWLEMWLAKEAPEDWTDTDENRWTEKRVMLALVDFPKDLSPGSLPIEFPLQDAVSFTKGCYIGQEVVARATYRGKPTRYWARFVAEQPGLQAGLVSTAAQPTVPVGKITSVFGNAGLGLLRLSAKDEPLVQMGPVGDLRIRAHVVGAELEPS